MRDGSNLRLAAMLARPGDAELREILANVTALDLARLDADFELWAHEAQLEPRREGWRTWLMRAGRGFGKTRAGAEWVTRLATMRGRKVRIALVGATIDEVRKVMVEGESGLLSVGARLGKAPRWEPSLGRLRWPGGSIAEAFSAENPDGLRGPQHHFAWCDELAKWARPAETWDNLQMGLRLGRRPRALVTTTPRPIPLLKRIEAEPWTIVTHGRSADNLNLPDRFLEVMAATYGGTRLGRQEIDGELIDDVEGALWTREGIEKARVMTSLPAISRGGGPAKPVEGPLHHPSGGPQHRVDHAPHGQALSGGQPGPMLLQMQGRIEMRRIVVGVDPPASSTGDACGIVACGLGRDGLGYVLGDHSVSGRSPEGWARAVVAAAEAWGAERVVVETNQGGEMVESVLRAVDAALPVRPVRARYGKVQRAEPVSLLFAGGKARFAGAFPELEDELCGLTSGGGYEGPGRSPDRADAMVWAMSELLLGAAQAEPRIRTL